MNKHVVISGGSRGLGQCLVEGMLKNGYSVSTFSRRETEFTKQLSDHTRFCYATADVSDTASLDQFLQAARERLGPPYALINSAGVAVDGVLPTMSEDDIHRVLDINLAGTLLLTRLVLRQALVERQCKAIINITSIIGLRGYNGLAAYSATKGGMDAITRSLARELGGRGIRVNSVAPGYLETEMTGELDQGQRQQIVRRTPLGRLGKPADVLGPVLFLLSDAAEFVTGQVLTVDGGITV